MTTSVRWSLLFLFLTSSIARAYGPAGHETVGAIADRLLAKRPTAAKITQLLDGMTLQRVSVIPDEIKAWDKKGPDDPRAFPHFPDHPEIDRQLREFWRANPPNPDPSSKIPSHHWFHYTDVPVIRAVKYSEGKSGRSQWDVVHMIAYCVSVLRGEIPEDNERKVTRPIAVILLAHYVGDIHQPLHVGADYFDESGHATDPDTGKPSFQDEGGNSITLQLRDDPPRGRGTHKKKLHGFWDMDTVNIVLGLASESAGTQRERRDEAEAAITKIADQMAATEPGNWRMPAKMDPKDYAEAWANEILPIAREAHERLNFTAVHPTAEKDRTVATGDAEEKPTLPDGKLYRKWAAEVVHDELHTAGWRLAELLERSVTSGKSAAAMTAVAGPRQGGATSTPQAPVAAASPQTEPIVRQTPASTPPAPAATPASPYGAYPANFREIVATWLTTKGIDGVNIDWQGEPKPADMPLRPGTHLYGYLVIFNTPARNGIGPKTRSVLIRDGQIVSANGF